MYTRFKSQKAGIKHGLNQIANSTRSRVVVPPAVATASNDAKPKQLDTINNDLCNKIDPLSLSSSSTSSISSCSMSTNSVASVNNQTSDPTSPMISIFSNDCSSLFSLNTTKKINTKPKSTKNSKREATDQDEAIDVNCITYVKSLWEQYSSEIGTQNGPLRYVEDTSQCPHLNGFVPLDMESWWAERSISCMINEKSSSPNTITSCNIDVSLNKSVISPIVSNPISENKLYEMSLIDSNNNNCAVERKYSIDISNNYKLTHSTTKSIMPSIHSFNNFQLCFS